MASKMGLTNSRQKLHNWAMQGRTCENLPASLVAGRVLERVDKSVGFHKIAASIIVLKDALLGFSSQREKKKNKQKNEGCGGSS